jgi:error-prone DNA polymerase
MRADAGTCMAISPEYAELHALSNFSFLKGASHPEELVIQAAAQGYAALALTDECSFSGCVRAHSKAKELGLKFIVGTELKLADDLKLVLLATDRASYGKLSMLISVARRNAVKGSYRIDRAQFEEYLPQGCLALWVPGTAIDPEEAHWLKMLFPDRLWVCVELLMESDDAEKLAALRSLGEALELPLCASGDVHMHHPDRRYLQDTLTAIRIGKPVSELGRIMFQNAQRHIRPRSRLARFYPAELLAETLRIAERCRFSLDELRYEYPQELVSEGHTPDSWLKHLVEIGIKERWPDGAKKEVLKQLEQELALIRELDYEPYFLTVHDLVRYARSCGILCQGRGSAANSIVCYCLGITEVDPANQALLFERFISRERNEPPDIDVDFEHERREEVIQYIYRRYGRDRAALTASVITYKQRSAIRDVGKALGLEPARIDALAKSRQWWDREPLTSESLETANIGLDSRIARQLRYLVAELINFPRHLSQHVGGFVISRGPLHELVPIENTAMPERSVIQWDKDDLESLGLLKVDVLALGMLTALRRALDYLSAIQGKTLALTDIPLKDSKVYEMLQKADSIGVFQVESRAQMSMLPRLKPRNFYDLVVQIAIVRPGPIQGEMVHPYLSRRTGGKEVTYPSDAVKAVLERTLGVPIFQEQVMQLAIVAGGFTAGEADQLRRAMAAWHRKGGLEPFREKLMDGMRARGYSETFAKQIFNQIKGFGEYGFPESHSASFAILAYYSAWLKCHQPAIFTCALLNSQPMGFYQPSQLVQDAQRHGVEVRLVDVLNSEVDCSLEPAQASGDIPGEKLEDLDRAHGALLQRPVATDRSPEAQTLVDRPALRLGLNQVKGLSKEGAKRIAEARRAEPFLDVQDLAARAGLNKADLAALAAADALLSLSGHRRLACWKVAGVEKATPLFGSYYIPEADPMLRAPKERESIEADYASLGLTLRRHPMALLRPRLKQLKIKSARELMKLPHGTLTRYAGLPICRQRPGSASGVIFVTLEDETGHINMIVWPSLIETYRHALFSSGLLAVRGVVQREDEVLHLVARQLEDLSPCLGNLSVASRDFH